LIAGLLEYFSDFSVVDICPSFYLKGRLARRMRLLYHPVFVRNVAQLCEVPHLRTLTDKRIVFLESPRNPFGYRLEFDDVIPFLKESSSVVIIDEAYAEFGSSSFIPFLSHHKNLIIMRTMSKAWALANLRVGYAMGQLIDDSFRSEYLLPYCMNGFSEAAACQLLMRSEYIRDTIAEMQAVRAEFLRRVERLGGIYAWPSEANYVCLETPKAAAISRQLDQYQVRVARLHELANYPPEWVDGLRISIPHDRSTLELILALLEAC
jgi:histidinol-phosphate aminotransferase